MSGLSLHPMDVLSELKEHTVRSVLAAPMRPDGGGPLSISIVLYDGEKRKELNFTVVGFELINQIPGEAYRWTK